MSQEELAERAGLSVRAIRDLESGRTRRPYPRTIQLLVDALGTPDLADDGRTELPAGQRHHPVPRARERAAPTVPRQLPAGVRHFVGRVREQQALFALLDEAAADRNAVVISAVGGSAGIGKTALAVHWAHRVADRFPDGQLYLNLRGFDPAGNLVQPAEAVRRFLDALDVSAERIPADLDAQAALYRSLLAGQRMLIVLDNARDAGQVRPLLPGSPGCLVLVTSRDQLTPLVAAEGAQCVTLDLLTSDEARELLSNRLGPERAGAEPGALATIIDRCARLPLALAIVAAHATAHPSRPLAALADELADTRTRLDRLSTGDPTTDVRTVFSWSYLALSPAAARLFRLLGSHPVPDISGAAAASFAGVPMARAQALLSELLRANLVVEHVPGRYTLHDLLRAYAGDLARTRDSDEERRAASHRLLDHYLHSAHAADRLLYPTRDRLTLGAPQPGVVPADLTTPRQALAWFTEEQSALMAAVDHAAATGFDRYAWQLAWMLWLFLYRRGHWHDWVATGHAAVAAAERLADPSAQAHAHRALAHAYTLLGRLDDARLQSQRAIDLFHLAGDSIGAAHTHHSLAYLAERQGSYAQALGHARECLTLFRTAGHQVGQARAYNAIGWYQAQLGDHRAALASCGEALLLVQQLGDREGQAATWDSLGYTHHRLGDHAEAITCYQQAIELYRDLEDRNYVAATLTHLGDSQHAAGNVEAARGAWRQALDILDDLDHPDAGAVRAKLHDAAVPADS